MKYVLVAVLLFGVLGGIAFADVAPQPKGTGCGGSAASSPAVIAGTMAGVVVAAILAQRRRSKATPTA